MATNSGMTLQLIPDHSHMKQLPHPLHSTTTTTDFTVGRWPYTFKGRGTILEGASVELAIQTSPRQAGTTR
jgi:hypothetical protein